MDIIKNYSSFIVLISVVTGLYFYSQVMIKIVDDRIDKKTQELEYFTNSNSNQSEINDLHHKLESIPAYIPIKKLDTPKNITDYTPLKTCSIDLLTSSNPKNNGKTQTRPDSINSSEISTQSPLEKYYNSTPKDSYVDLYQGVYQKFLHNNKKESFPFLSSNNETLQQNYTHFTDLDKPPEFLDKGTSTNIKAKNYYKLNQAHKRSNNKHSSLPPRKKRNPRFKCQRKYEVCDTSHVPL